MQQNIRQIRTCSSPSLSIVVSIVSYFCLLLFFPIHRYNFADRKGTKNRADSVVSLVREKTQYYEKLFVFVELIKCKEPSHKNHLPKQHEIEKKREEQSNVDNLDVSTQQNNKKIERKKKKKKRLVHYYL